jgi:NAD(P)-dependent dehydrogenase (short-subunit alcohol dehydrogenase family)
MDFNGRHVVVTGGTGALGSAVVDMLIGAGATCHVPHRAQSAPDDRGGRTRLVPHSNIELADEAAVERLYAAVPDLWASIHLAGGFAAGPIGGTGKDDFYRQIETNLTTCFLCCHGAVKTMLDAGKGGRIVNVAARPALEWRLGAGMTAYAASKAGVAALTAALAEEVAKDGILVNAVAPSIMDTPANRKAMPKAKHADWPKVEEVASTILFLASPDNHVTRGAIVPVYGRS